MKPGFLPEKYSKIVLGLGHSSFAISTLGLLNYVMPTNAVWKEIYLLPYISALALTIVTLNQKETKNLMRRKEVKH